MSKSKTVFGFAHDHLRDSIVDIADAAEYLPVGMTPDQARQILNEYDYKECATCGCWSKITFGNECDFCRLSG